MSTEDNKYYYIGRNSKGEPKFRRDTKESSEEVESYWMENTIHDAYILQTFSLHLLLYNW